MYVKSGCEEQRLEKKTEKKTGVNLFISVSLVVIQGTAPPDSDLRA